MDWRQPLHRFNFYQKTAIDKKVGSESRVDERTFKLHADQLLPVHRIAQGLKSSGKESLVDGLE